MREITGRLGDQAHVLLVGAEVHKQRHLEICAAMRQRTARVKYCVTKEEVLGDILQVAMGGRQHGRRAAMAACACCRADGDGGAGG
jgi:hypothetical protein